MYGEGISETGDVLDLAVEEKIVHKAGAWFLYNENKTDASRKTFLTENPKVMEEIRNKVLAKRGLIDAPATETDEATGEIVETNQQQKLKSQSWLNYSNDERTLEIEPLKGSPSQYEHNKEIINIALRYLCLREYSEKELIKILQKRQFENSELEIAIEYLRSKDYLSDDRYVRQKFNSLKLKGFSTSYIIRFFKNENIDVDVEEIEGLELTSDEDNIKKLILKSSQSQTRESLIIKRLSQLLDMHYLKDTATKR